MDAQIRQSVELMEKQLGKKLGDLKKPLLLSVRSGARDSMPGMMDTILNLGLNDETVEASTVSSFKPRFKMVSIIPGIESRAPERTDKRRGFFKSPSFLPNCFSINSTD